MFQADAYLSIDLQQKLLTIVRKPTVFEEGGIPKVDLQERSFDPGDALLDEIRSFVSAVDTTAAGRSFPARTACARSRPRCRIAELVNRGANGGGTPASISPPAGILDG